MLEPIDLEDLTLASGGFRWETYRQSDNVLLPDQYTPSELGGLWNNYTQELDYDRNQNEAQSWDYTGWRQDQDTGDVTYIDHSGYDMPGYDPADVGPSDW